MTPIDFRASVVVADNGKVLIVLFDGGDPPAPAAVLRCTRETARAVKKAIGSALSDKRS